MYELIKVTDRDYYIQNPTKIGLHKISDTQVCLIDSGCDKDAGKKLLKIINENGWTLKAIYNTHSHADHIGGNRYLQEQTGCKIYAKGIECCFTRHTSLEPISIYGANPYKELKHKFLMASESSAEPLTADCLPYGFEIIPLPGHSPDMVGFRTPDNTVFLADVLTSKETTEKYGIGYLFDVGVHLQTLKEVMNLRANIFIPSHAQPCCDASELARFNIDTINSTAEIITDFCEMPLCFEDILQKLFFKFELTMSHQQYVLIGSTLRSYLSWLKENGKINSIIENNKILWVKCK